MAHTFEHSSRPGSASLSVVTFVGLAALAAILWQIAPGYVLLLMIPALAACLWQMTRVPTYGIKITPTSWHILGGYDDLVIPTGQIAYLSILERGADRHIGLMLRDGTEIVLPVESLPDPSHLIRAATTHGIPVREVS